MNSRYDRNIGTISPREQKLLGEKSVCVIGCGGLGGGIIEGLTRLGVGRLTIVDGDVFDISNLNRQVLSNEDNIGMLKAEEGMRQMGQINSETRICPVCAFYTEENSREIISGHDVVIDALDNINSRKILEDACEEENIPLVHGAIAGWHGQVAVIMPGDRLIHTLYDGDENYGMEKETGNPSFTPAVTGALQVAETLKLLLNREGVLANKVLSVDILNHQYELIDFGD